MPLPRLDHAEASILNLHHAAILFAPIKKALFPKRRNYLHLAFSLEENGFTTGKLPLGGALRLDWSSASMVYERPNGEIVTFPLNEHQQMTLFQALLEALKADNLADFLADVPNDKLVLAFLNKLYGEGASAKIPEMTQTQPLTVNLGASAEYGQALYRVYTALARFRVHLDGHMTPIVGFPEHFDLSMLWFVDGEMDDSKAHLNFGFAPYTPNMTSRPYLYAYAYPYPEPFQAPELPSPAYWNTQGWRGVVIPYDALVDLPNPEAEVERLCRQIFDALSDIWD